MTRESFDIRLIDIADRNPFLLNKIFQWNVNCGPIEYDDCRIATINFIQLQDASRTICRNWKYLLNLAAMMNIKNTYKSTNVWIYVQFLQIISIKFLSSIYREKMIWFWIRFLIHFFFDSDKWFFFVNWIAKWKEYLILSILNRSILSILIR